jgi:hypothetical protein
MLLPQVHRGIVSDLPVPQARRAYAGTRVHAKRGLMQRHTLCRIAPSYCTPILFVGHKHMAKCFFQLPLAIRVCRQGLCEHDYPGCRVSTCRELDSPWSASAHQQCTPGGQVIPDAGSEAPSHTSRSIHVLCNIGSRCDDDTDILCNQSASITSRATGVMPEQS